MERRVAETRRFQRRLFTAAALTPGQRLIRRGIWAIGIFLAVLAVLWVDRAGLRDDLDGEISFIDLLYFTFVTITTVGYGDIVPVTDRARLLDAVFITPARLIFIMIFVGTAYELVIQRWVEGFRMARLQAQLRNHVVICGFGAVGQMAAREILARGASPEQIVVIDLDDAVLQDATELHLTGLKGDASRDDVLEDAAVERARGVIVSAGSDAVNALVSLAVRRRSKSRMVVAAVGLDKQEIFEHSGADAVVASSTIGGYVIADALESPPVANLLVDILSAHGQAEWRELEVTPGEVGTHPQARRDCVVIAVRRGPRLLWPWQAEAQSLAQGDHVIVVRPTQPAPAARA